MWLMLLALLAPNAWAARVYWVGAPTDADRAAVARTVEGATTAPLSEMMPSLSAGDSLSVLANEIASCKPLFEVFDGELQVMARLQKAIADVQVLRSAADRQLVHSALIMQGTAVQRYFQGALGTEDGAQPYRTMISGQALVSSWTHAVALYTPESASVAPPVLPDPAASLAFDATQASVRLRPSASVAFGALAEGAAVFVDGVRVETTPGFRLLLSPGRHYLHVQVGEVLLWRFADDIAPGQTVAVEAPFGPAERDALLMRLTGGKDGWAVPTAVSALARGEPLYLAVPGAKKPRLLRIDGGVAANVPITAESAGGGGPLVRVAAGAGWLSTGDFFLQNVDDGAPYTVGTVNSFAPAGSVAAAWRRGLLEVGAGVDVQLAVGDVHTLPIGASHTRTFVYPYVAVGIPWLQLTLGPQFPWYFGIGGQARVPLAGPVELYARGVYGVGVPLAREGDAPDFKPLPAVSAWGGVSLRFGG
jgi:hypothetical protein